MADDKKIIFSMVGVSKIIPPQRQILKDIYLSFFYGAKIGIIGLNGSGKSTLLKIIAGIDKNYQGNVVFSPGYSVGYLEQDPRLDPDKTVKEVVQEGVQPVLDLLREYDEVNNAFADPEVLENPDRMDALINRQAELQDKLDACDAWNIDNKLERAMDALRCPPDDKKISVLSGGERRRVALCRLLLQQPDILLLDEPTNHLDAESIDWLEQHLQQYPGTVIAVTHDRYFLDHVAGWILELDRGEGIPWKGNYSSWLDQKTKRMAQEEKQASKRRKTLERELEWVRMAPKARQAKGKARLSSYDRLLNEDQKEREEKLEIFIPNGPRLGNKVIEARHLAKAYDDRALFTDLEFSLPPNGIVGVIGPNGAGKTTLIRIINHITAPDSGRVIFDGHPLSQADVADIGYLPEERGLYKKMKVGEQAIFFARLKGLSRADAIRQLRAWFEKFDILDWWNKKVEELSKGMAQKVQFIVTVLHRPRLLIFDEPFSGFDPINANLLKEEILKLRDEGSTIIFSTHNMSSVEEICDNITLINKSHNILSGNVEDLRREYFGNRYDLTYTGDRTALMEALGQRADGYIIKDMDTRGRDVLQLHVADGASLREVLDIANRNVELAAFTESMASMNDIFIRAVEDNNSFRTN